ncbi:hypothetical protein, partial [Staphylococcus aureus]
MESNVSQIPSIELNPFGVVMSMFDLFLPFIAISFAIVTISLLIRTLRGVFIDDSFPFSSRDIDKTVDYMKDNNVSSCKVNLTKKDIEIFSDESNVVRTSRRNSNRFRQVGEKKITHSDDNDILPFVTAVAVGTMLSDV